MKIYVTHSTSYDYKEELYEPLRSSELNIQHEIILPHETEEFINSKEIIQQVDLIIAEVSYASTGQGIELGWAESFDKKVICIYKKGTKYSGSLNVVSEIFIEYESNVNMVEKLTSVIPVPLSGTGMTAIFR